MNGSRPIRVLYAAGPGDVLGTYRHWKASRHDPHEVARTYSGQLYDACAKLGATALVISCQDVPTNDRDDDEQFTVMSKPVPFNRSSNALLYHCGRMWYGLWLTIQAWRHRAQVAVVADGTHWFCLSLMAMTGVRVIPSMHRALWPAGFRPHGRVRNMIARLNGCFWRWCAWATVAVSPECLRQVRAIAGTVKGPLLQVRAQYAREQFSDIAPPPRSRRPLCVMYAGRIERDKGVDDLLMIAQRLEKTRPGQFRWELCGSGSHESELRSQIQERQLEHIMSLHGQLDRDAMKQAYSRSHVVVVPTTSRFIEGLNKVTVEAVLAGRPVVTSRVAHATDVLGEAVVEVEPDQPDSYEQAIVRLADDEAFYETRRAACAMSQWQFYDSRLGWGAAIEALLEAAAGGRTMPMQVAAAS